MYTLICKRIIPLIIMMYYIDNILGFVEKTNNSYLYTYINFSLFFFRLNVYADRKHINYRSHNDVSNDYYYNYYDIEVLFFEMNQRDVRV